MINNFQCLFSNTEFHADTMTVRQTTATLFFSFTGENVKDDLLLLPVRRASPSPLFREKTNLIRQRLVTKELSFQLSYTIDEEQFVVNSHSSKLFPPMKPMCVTLLRTEFC